MNKAANGAFGFAIGFLVGGLAIEKQVGGLIYVVVWIVGTILWFALSREGQSHD